jgi:hypothetical protein
MIGKNVFYATQADGMRFPTISVVAVLPDVDSKDATPSNQAGQRVHIAQGEVESIKLKVFPDYGPDGLRYSVNLTDSDQYTVQPQKFSASKEREDNALAEWDRK